MLLFATSPGVPLRDLMDRMAHPTTRAALMYLHKTAGRDRKIADALSQLVTDARKSKADQDGQGPESTEDTDTPVGHAEGTEGGAGEPEGHIGGTTADQ